VLKLKYLLFFIDAPSLNLKSRYPISVNKNNPSHAWLLVEADKDIGEPWVKLLEATWGFVKLLFG
jgi:hypothetical protein